MKKATRNKLWHTLGVYAADSDFASAGYLGLEDNHAALQTDQMFRSLSKHLAILLISEFDYPEAAKNAARTELCRDRDTGKPAALDDDQRGLIDGFMDRISPVIDNVSNQSVRARKISRILFRLPDLLRMIVWASLWGLLLWGIVEMLIDA